MRRIKTIVGAVLAITIFGMLQTAAAEEPDYQDILAFCAATNALVGAYTGDDTWFRFAREFNNMTERKERVEYFIRSLDLQYTEGHLSWNEIVEGTTECNRTMLAAGVQPR